MGIVAGILGTDFMFKFFLIKMYKTKQNKTNP